MNKRTQALYNAAKDALEEAGFEFNTQSVGVTISLAAMLDAALPPSYAKPKPAPLNLAFTPSQLFDALEAGCSDRLNLRPYNSSTFARLAKDLAKTPGLEEADLERLVGWINSGALGFWSSKPTWSHVCRHVTNWIAQARTWEANGGQGATELGGEAWR